MIESVEAVHRYAFLRWTLGTHLMRKVDSQSYLSVSQDCSVAHFRGTLDTQTLGGAGFASQRTVYASKTWDLSKYDGIELSIQSGDDKKYTFILKDEALPRNADNGREQSTISYEYDFRVPESESTGEHLIRIPWTDFKATFRGKEKADADPLDTKQIKRFSIMARRYAAHTEPKADC